MITQHATRNTQHATRNTQHATRNTQHATRNTQLSYKQLFCYLSLAALIATAGPEIATAQQSDDSLEEITVTGSRIARKDLIAASPVNIITAEDLEISGVNSVATILNELPSAGIPGSVDTATNFRTTTTGINTIDLRNLRREDEGGGRTLVLVNGRRHIGGSNGSSVVDVSMIPAALVERVEIVTGGASAVYGSEAIAGVVNFIYKDDYEGLTLDARYGGSELGGATEKDISLLAGRNFAEGQGNATFYLGYSDRGILRSSQRKLSANDANNSSFGPKGNFFVPGTGFITEDDSTGRWDKPLVLAEDGFDRNAVRLIRVPNERIQFNGHLKYEFNRHMEIFNETSYNRLTSYSQLEPSIVGEFISVGNSIANIRVPIDNPFIPAELRTAVLAGNPNATEFQMRRRFVEIGPRTSDIQRQTFRTVLGAKGDINDDWSYEAYYQYGLLTQDQTNGGVFNTLNFYNSLRVEDDGSGGRRCVDAFARDLGCVPINVFGAGSIAGAALDWVKVDNQLTLRMTQQVAALTIAGSLMDLPAGELGVAFGGEWREEESRFNSDSLAQSGLTSGNTTPNTIGKYDVKEVFAEAVVPLFADVPFGDYIGLEAAVRYADYSTVGGSMAYKGALDWRPFADLRLRGGYSTAVKAPSIGDLFDPGSETFRSFVDPCAFGGKGGPSATGVAADVYEAQSAQVQANCATIPGTATLDPFANNIRSAGGLAAGNPDLQEETSRTWTAGFVYSPGFVPGLNVTVDYYNIEVNDAISTFDAQTTVDQCVRQPDFPNNPFCMLIERAGPGEDVPGLINRVNALAINVADFKASGIDFALDYSFGLIGGEMKVNVNGTHSMANDYIPFAGGNTVSDQGEIGLPDWKVNTTLIYNIDRWRFGWSTRFIDAVNVENDSVNAFGTVSRYFYNDLQVRYFIDQESKYQVFAGIDNVFDQKPPELGQGIPRDVTGTNTAADVYDPIRRYFYGGFKVSL